MGYEAAHVLSKQSAVSDVVLFLSQMSRVEAVFYIMTVSILAYLLKIRMEKKA